jgi:hypothetical protein
MFQLYKKRNFNDYINDTFQFFRLHGKHFFTLYFTINGAFLLLATVLIYFIFKIYFEYIFSSISGGMVAQQNNTLGNLFANNSGTLIVVAILGILFLVFISIIQFAFPLIYLDLLDKNKGPNFSTKDVIVSLKQKAFKLIKFVIGLIFIFTPLMIIIFGLNVLLCFIIIGIPLFFITIPAVMCWMHLSFNYYIVGDERFFSALSSAYSDIREQFWPIVFSTMLMYIIIQVTNTIFTMIPYIIGILFVFTNPENQNGSQETFNLVAIIMTAVVVVSLMANYILNNLLLINEGIIYYSRKDVNENISSNNSIDLIGSESE